MDTLGSLLQRTLDGDLDAFGEVISRSQDMAFGCAYAVLGDFDDAQDATQEAFILAYRKLASLRRLESFPGWLRRLVLTACNRITRRPKPPTADLEEAEAVAPRDSDPPREAERNELGGSVLAAVRALSPASRMAATLYYIDGYSVAQVADFLDVPAGTVKSRLHEARKQLKETMLEMARKELVTAKPGDEVKREVLKEVAVGFPPGTITASWDSADGTETMFLSTPDAAKHPETAGLIGLTFDRVAAATIVAGPWDSAATTEAAGPRRELLDLVRDLLGKSGVSVERVVLDVGPHGQASARVRCRGQGEPYETPIPASVGLALAYRTKAQVLATPRLMRAAVAGEDRAPQWNRKDVEALRHEIMKGQQSDRLLDIGWENGLDPAAGIRTVRWHVDETEGTIAVFVGRRRKPVAVVTLDDYRGGVEMLRRWAGLKREYGRLYRDCKVYRRRLWATGDDLRCELTPVRKA